MSRASKRPRRTERQIRIEEVVLPAVNADPAPGVLGRALVGWMSTNQMMAFVRAYAGDEEEAVRLGQQAEARRRAVTALSRPIQQAGLIQEMPPRLAIHVKQFNESPVGQTATSEGFAVEFVDLTRVVAFQTFVRIASVRNYVLMLKPGDVESAARIALPINFRSEMRARFDTLNAAWNVFSMDTNLRVVGQFGQPNMDGTITLGYNFAIQSSLVKVQQYQGRAFLSDGYHRTVALLRKGFTHSLALVREVPEFEMLGALGHLPVDAFMGDRPPLLADYWNELVSMELKVPKGARHFILRPQQLS